MIYFTSDTHFYHAKISYNRQLHGAIHLYGHCHAVMEEELNKVFPNRRSMDVGVDNIYKLYGEYRPISLTEVYNHFGV